MTTEEIYLDKIWLSMNESLEDEILLSLDQENKITSILKEYSAEKLKASEEKAVSANERREKFLFDFIKEFREEFSGVQTEYLLLRAQTYAENHREIESE